MDICHKQEIYLLHGSRGGLKGEIRPCSRENCDFGRGFYMGTNPNQVKGLVVSDRNPVFYELKVDLTKIPTARRLYLTGKDWLRSCGQCWPVGSNQKNLQNQCWRNGQRHDWSRRTL